MNDKVRSYSSADILPAKLIQDGKLIDKITSTKMIPPVHVQFIPTNKCNLNCTFCSCSKEDRNVEMRKEKAIKLIQKLSKLGCESVTITGGGEPLLHPDIGAIIFYFLSLDIEVGLVSNGLLLYDNISKIEGITWCRISNSDSRSFTGEYRDNIEQIISVYNKIDWAFSHVVSPDPNVKEIIRIIDIANKYDQITHVRLVADILQSQLVDMKSLEKLLLELKKIDCDKVIFQGRDLPKRGGDCYICYLKPVIGADEKIYACCGAQYVFKNPSRLLPKELCIGDTEDIEKIIKLSSVPFDGRICDRCYYSSYNEVLKILLSDIEHERFK